MVRWMLVIALMAFSNVAFSQEVICDGQTCRLAEKTKNVVQSSAAVVEKVVEVPFQIAHTIANVAMRPATCQISQRPVMTRKLFRHRFRIGCR